MKYAGPSDAIQRRFTRGYVAISFPALFFIAFILYIFHRTKNKTHNVKTNIMHDIQYTLIPSLFISIHINSTFYITTVHMQLCIKKQATSSGYLHFITSSQSTPSSCAQLASVVLHILLTCPQLLLQCGQEGYAY